MFCSMCNKASVVVAGGGGLKTEKTFHCGIYGYLGSKLHGDHFVVV